MRLQALATPSVKFFCKLTWIRACFFHLRHDNWIMEGAMETDIAKMVGRGQFSQLYRTQGSRGGHSGWGRIRTKCNDLCVWNHRNEGWWMKALSIKTDNLSLMSGPHRVKEDN